MRVSRGYRIVPPLRGSIPFCFLPRADALGYLLDAPTGAESLGQGDINRPESNLTWTKSFWTERARSADLTCWEIWQIMIFSERQHRPSLPLGLASSKLALVLIPSS